jgi:hypothetical protein
MSETPADSLRGGLSYQDSLPLSWRRLPEGSGTRLAHVDEANSEFLRMMTALEEHTPPKADGNPELAHELLRLESKINLMLDLVGRVLAQSLKLPPVVPVALGAEALRWTAQGKAPAPGERVLVELYLRPEYPRPLTLTGHVKSVASSAGGKEVTLPLEGLGEEVHDWLERMIFRHHRRSVAHARRHGPSS